jgi:hypothetical protein
MFGLDADTLRNIKKVFATLPNLEKVILYGSRAKGNYKDNSLKYFLCRFFIVSMYSFITAFYTFH